MNTQRKSAIFFTVIAVVSCVGAVNAEETARVVSSTPITQQIGVPQQVCVTPGVSTSGTATAQCSTQTIYENRTVAYQVVYEYANRRYSVQMPQDPGPNVKLQISVAPLPNQPAPVALATDAPAVASPPSQPTALPYPAVVYYDGYPGYVTYYGSPFYRIAGPALGYGYYGGYVGFSGGYGRFGGGHRHR